MLQHPPAKNGVAMKRDIRELTAYISPHILCIEFFESMQSNSDIVRTHDLQAIERRLQTGMMSADDAFMVVGDARDTPLFYTVHCKWSQGIALFMLYGANPNTFEKAWSTTALEYAIQDHVKDPNNRLYVYHLMLLGYFPKINIDAPILGNTMGTNAFMMAASLDHHYSLKWLHEGLGANPRMRDAHGFNALGYAMRGMEKNARKGSLSAHAMIEDETNNEAQLNPTIDYLIRMCRLDPIEYMDKYPYISREIKSAASSLWWASCTLKRHGRSMKRGQDSTPEV